MQASDSPDSASPLKNCWEGWRHDVLAAVLLTLIVFLGFNANQRSIVAGDTIAARYLPFSVLQNRSVLLDPIVATVAQGRKVQTVEGEVTSAFWVVKVRDGHFVSLYPVTLPLLITPLYFPAVHYLEAYAWDPLLFDRVARVMEKVIASLMATASVVLLYFLLRRRSNLREAVLLSLVYAFGTTTWVISSQALWQHGLAQLLIVATLLLLTGTCTPLRAASVGLLCALIAVARPPDAILAAGLGLYGLWWAGRKSPLLLLAGLLPAALTLAYNLLAIGHFAGAYGLTVKPHSYNDDVLAGVAALLFSPTRGLFVFSPFLLFLPLYFGLVLRDRRYRGLTVAVSLAVIAQLIGYGMVDWRQGVSWGPRWLTDMLPLLIWMLPPIVAVLSRPAKAVFVAACGCAIAIQGVGAFWYTGISDSVLMTASEQVRDRMKPFWDVRNASFLVELQHARAPADLLVELQGNVDVINVVDVLSKPGTSISAVERHLEISGWALTDGRTPTDVAARIDGEEFVGTSQFFTRPDVVKTLGIDTAAGWKLHVPTAKLAPGAHVLTILVRSHPGSDPRVLRERSFNLAVDSDASALDQQLAAAAQHASKFLAENQHAPGYWLTSHTPGLQFEKARSEMNTYTNALMLDIVGPVAKDTGLEAALHRTRDFLTSQIEPSGLVRYHGLPKASTIGTLGCVITPDTDDTALVWRVAPDASRKRLHAALEFIDKFRRSDGLYRTWLAPQGRYECIDPGRDPNPADIGIQMHLFMLLTQDAPSAAQALCTAMMQKVDDDSFWVYYAKAPLMVLLRQKDLRSAGCPLSLPARASETTIPGQALWIDLVRHLIEEQPLASTKQSLKETNLLLRKIAASEFTYLDTTPPLLYHNDQTASIKRFYWSKEIGYALWLRLYDEYKNKCRQLNDLCVENDSIPNCVAP